MLVLNLLLIVGLLNRVVYLDFRVEVFKFVYLLSYLDNFVVISWFYGREVGFMGFREREG